MNDIESKPIETVADLKRWLEPLPDDTKIEDLGIILTPDS